MPTRPAARSRKPNSSANPRSRRAGSASGASQSKASARRTLELQTLQCFRTIFGSARKHDADVRRIAGIPGSQLWALSEIERSAGMSVNGLSERMALHQTTASNLINALVERKFVRRVRDESDQRVVRLYITTEGKRALLRAPGPYAGLLVDALRNLEDDQLVLLRKHLQGLLNVLRDAATNAAGDPLMGE